MIKCCKRGVYVLPLNLCSLFSSYSCLIDILGIIISLLTLITMLRFKHRIRIELDRRDLSNTRKRLQKELDGYAGSLMDGIYTVDFLQRIDLHLNDLLTSYKCFSLRLRCSIRWTLFFLNFYCISDASCQKTKYRHRLCKKLRRILVLLRKED